MDLTIHLKIACSFACSFWVPVMIAKLKYVARERSGLLLYYRQIPADLREFYQGQIHRRKSLATHDSIIAAPEALRLAKVDDDIWAALRNGASDVKTARAAIDNTQYLETLRRITRAGPPEHTFSDALGLYFKRHPGKGTKFTADVNRVFNFAKDIIGNPPLSKIKRVDASKVLDAFLAKDLKTASVRRNMAVLSAIMNGALIEYEIDAKNPFSSHKIPNLLEDAQEVPSFSEDELRQIGTAALAQKTTQALIPAGD
jgi:hypothetical protein